MEDLVPGDVMLLEEGAKISADGRVVRVVTQIGMSTEFGKIASLTQNMGEKQSPLQKQLDHLTKQITVFALFMGIVFLVLDVAFVHNSIAASFIFALGMVVAFIPEGLLPTVIYTLHIVCSVRFL